MRGSGGGVFADIGFLDIYALDVVLAQRGYELHIRILDENIVGGVYQITHVYRVSHAGNDPCLLSSVVAVDLIPLTHAGEYLDGAGVFLYLVLLHVCVEPGLILLGDIFKLERRAFRYRQIINIIVAVIADHVYEL